MNRYLYILIICLIHFSCDRTDPNNADPDPIGNTYIKTFGGGFEDVGNSIARVSDGSFVVSGWTVSQGAGLRDIWLMKIDINAEMMWQQVYGDNNNDWGYSVTEMSDNGFLLTGRSSSKPYPQIAVGTVPTTSLVRTDASGNEQWFFSYGPIQRSRAAYQAIETTDGIVFLAAYNVPYVINVPDQQIAEGVPRIAAYKVDLAGNLQWSYLHTHWSNAFSMAQSDDGGFIILGEQQNELETFEVVTEPISDIILFKLDQQGQLQWQKDYDYAAADIGKAIVAVDDGFVFTGETGAFSQNNFDVIIVKVDPLGNEIWHQTLGGAQNEFAYDLIQTSSNEFVIAGTTFSYDIGNGDVWLVKFSANGNHLWSRSIGGDNVDIGRQLVETDDLGYMIIGETDSFGAANTDMLIIKTDKNGRVNY